MEHLKNSTVTYQCLEELFKTQIELGLDICGAAAVILNGVLIFVMLRAPVIRKNQANYSMFAILMVNLIFGAMIPMLKQVRKKLTLSF